MMKTTMVRPMTTTMMTAMTSDRSGLVRIALIVAAALAAFLVNILSDVPLSLVVLPAVGAAAYFALVRLGDYDPHIACDHVQTGEAALGSFVLFVSSAFLAKSPALPILVFAAVLIYEFFISAVIAPDKRELAVNGLLTQTILAAALFFIITGGAAAGAAGPDAVLLGYFAVNPRPWPHAAAALAITAVVFSLARALRPELRSWSQGTAFHVGSGMSRTAIAAGLVVTRGILTTIALLFSGWTCGIGISVRRLSPAAHADTVTIVSLLGFQQVIIMIAHLSGTWYAAGCALFFSYALYLIHLTKRTHRYDRNQKS